MTNAINPGNNVSLPKQENANQLSTASALGPLLKLRDAPVKAFDPDSSSKQLAQLLQAFKGNNLDDDLVTTIMTMLAPTAPKPAEAPRPETTTGTKPGTGSGKASGTINPAFAGLAELSGHIPDAQAAKSGLPFEPFAKLTGQQEGSYTPPTAIPTAAEGLAATPTRLDGSTQTETDTPVTDPADQTPAAANLTTQAAPLPSSSPDSIKFAAQPATSDPATPHPYILDMPAGLDQIAMTELIYSRLALAEFGIPFMRH